MELALTELNQIYDDIQDPVCIFDINGNVFYCNEAFASISGVSLVRLLKQKVSLFNTIKTIDDSIFDFATVENFLTEDGIRICKYETEKTLRGLGQFQFKNFYPLSDFDKNLYFLTFKDLTVEEELVRSFKFETSILNKKIVEMNQLVDIFQKIRLLDKPQQILNEYLNYFIKSSKISTAAIYAEESMKFINNPHLDNSVSTVEIENELNPYFRERVVSKYISHKLKIQSKKGQAYFCSIVPFRFGSKSMNVVFLFETLDMMNEFPHQSAIILNEQLNLIINNLNLKELSYTDGLTRLKNNMYFRNKLDEIFAKNQSAHLVLLDVDFFKRINDQYGHPGGDEVLIFLGETITKKMSQYKTVQEDATIARIGGEEFAVLIPNLSTEFAKDFAEDLRKSVEQSKVKFNENEICFTISLGIAGSASVRIGEKQGPKILYKLADDALYISKRTGRNRLTVTHENE